MGIADEADGEVHVALLLGRMKVAMAPVAAPRLFGEMPLHDDDADGFLRLFVGAPSQQLLCVLRVGRRAPDDARQTLALTDDAPGQCAQVHLLEVRRAEIVDRVIEIEAVDIDGRPQNSSGGTKAAGGCR